MEDDLNVFEKEDDLIFSKLKTTPKKMQLKAIKCKNNTILENGRQPQFI